jgi:uridine monophosphate synthetase
MPLYTGFDPDTEEGKKLSKRNTELIKENNIELLYDYLFEYNCVKFGQFTLKNGTVSPIYFDFRPLISYPSLLEHIGRVMASKIQEIGCDRIAGVIQSGIPIAVSTSLYSKIPMIYMRKEYKNYGTKQLIEGEYKKGDRILIIDDVVTDGGSKVEAIEHFRFEGLVVEDVLVILDREQGAKKMLKGEYNCKLQSLIDVKDMISYLFKTKDIDNDIKQKVNQMYWGGSDKCKCKCHDLDLLSKELPNCSYVSCEKCENLRYPKG